MEIAFCPWEWVEPVELDFYFAVVFQLLYVSKIQSFANVPFQTNFEHLPLPSSHCASCSTSNASRNCPSVCQHTEECLGCGPLRMSLEICMRS